MRETLGAGSGEDLGSTFWFRAPFEPTHLLAMDGSPLNLDVVDRVLRG